MTFNIWYGATATNHGKVIEAIEAARADVVGMREPYARLSRIARALGFHVSPRMHVISRYPILGPEGSDGRWAYLVLGPGEIAAIANTHLPCCPYTPYRIVHKGMDRADALEQEARTRVPGALRVRLGRPRPDRLRLGLRRRGGPAEPGRR